MIFVHNCSSATYTVRAGVIERDNYGRLMREEKGLRAKFRGSGRLFDSEAAQNEHGWTDEQRLQVEAFLLSHTDFHAMPSPSGVGAQPRIYLAPGERVPPEHEEVYAKTMARLVALGQAPPVGETKQAELPDAPLRCFAFELSEGDLVRCSKLAAPGSDLCEAEHVTSPPADMSGPEPKPAAKPRARKPQAVDA